MSKPSLDDIAFAVYVFAMNLNGKCPYCGENLSGDKPKYKMQHWETEHKS